MENHKNTKWPPSVWKSVYIDKKTENRNLKNVPQSLNVTIKGFNVDSYFISVKYELYNKALSLYFILPFEQFPTFF